jgi:hypothetical protein
VSGAPYLSTKLYSIPSDTFPSVFSCLPPFYNDDLVCTKEDSTVVTFGAGDNGQLGHGATDDYHTPTLIESMDSTSLAVSSCPTGKVGSRFQFKDRSRSYRLLTRSKLPVPKCERISLLLRLSRGEVRTPKSPGELFGVRTGEIYARAIRRPK